VIQKLGDEQHYSKGVERMYIQDLKARTVPNGIWYCAYQAIVLHITESNGSDFVNRTKGTNSCTGGKRKEAMHSQVPQASQLAHIWRQVSF
jgi:hypothetical protein